MVIREKLHQDHYKHIMRAVVDQAKRVCGKLHMRAGLEAFIMRETHYVRERWRERREGQETRRKEATSQRGNKRNKREGGGLIVEIGDTQRERRCRILRRRSG